MQSENPDIFASTQKKIMLKNITAIVVMLFLFALVTRIIISAAYYNEYDTFWYRKWAFSMSDGFFNIYSRAESISLDYPPLYLFFLYITNLLYKIFGTNCHQYIQMLLMKMWPVLADMACGFFLYRICSRQYGVLTGAAASFLWLFNPATLFNSAFWGQTDGLMCLLLLITFNLLETKHPFLAACMFAVAGLTKYQSLFFTPIFLYELFVKYRAKKFFAGIGVAAATVAAVFLPFMIGAKNPLLFFDVYLGGQSTYPHCTLNAYNIYGIFSLNWVEDSKIAFGGLSFHSLSIILTILTLIFIILILIFAKKKCVWTVSFLFMNTFFMFTTRMHERYQFVVIIFILMATIIHRNRQLFYCFGATSFMIFLNQAIPMFQWNNGSIWLEKNNDTVMAAFSLINLIVYLVTAAICINFLFTDNECKNAKETEMLI